MLTIEHIKRRVKELFESSPNIHVNVSRLNPKLIVNNAPAKIVAVYPHIFQIEEYSSGNAKRHIVQYNELLTKHFEIIEL